jgi:hypothetical protein
MKTLITISALMLGLVQASSQQVSIGNNVSVGNNVTIGALASGPPPPPPGGLQFSPVAGTYVGGRAITISYSPGTAGIFYTGTGATATMASMRYSVPIYLGSPAVTNLSAAAVTLGTSVQGMNDSTTGWTIVTLKANQGCPTPTCPRAKTGGGIGNNQPSHWGWTFGANSSSPMTQTLSTTATSGETQAIFAMNQSGGTANNNATAMAMDKWVMPTAGNSAVANNEMDMEHTDTAHTINGIAVNHNVGLQCNQQSGSIGWEVNGTGAWNPTHITVGCDVAHGGLDTTSYTNVIYAAHWIIGDKGCGGFGCIYLDSLTIITGCSLSTGTCSGTPSINYLGGGPNGCSLSSGCHWISSYPVGTVAARSESWASACGTQDQIDLQPPAAGKTQTGGRLVAYGNITCGIPLQTITGKFTIN